MKSTADKDDASKEHAALKELLKVLLNPPRPKKTLREYLHEQKGDSSK